MRQRLNVIAGLEGDDFTDEVRAELAGLEAEYGDLEIRHRAAIHGGGRSGTGGGGIVPRWFRRQ